MQWEYMTASMLADAVKDPECASSPWAFEAASTKTPATGR